MLAIHPGDHVGLPYGDDPLKAAVGVACQGLAAGGQVLVFPPIGAIGRYVAAVGADPMLAAARDHRRLEVLDSRDVQLAGGRFDPAGLYRSYADAAAAAVNAGFTGLWVTVDMGWALDADPEVLTDFEARAYPLFTDATLTAACHYDTERFGSDRARSACAAHPVTHTGTRLSHRRHGSVLALAGETDLSNQRAWQTLLADVEDNTHLDLTRMRFIDAAGLRAVAALTSARAGIDVTATPYVARLLRLVGAACTPDTAASSPTD
jgi:anti-anti-sigma regulatory factor